ncbi:MAG TPA: ATP-binding protein [Steroidobacteraceae bacterium]|nr:ATP-binding protein [Steroidobacteraceae bacterium]
MSRCIVVSGPPGAGKSRLAAALAAHFGWPLLAKDDYKERVFRHLGGRDRGWSRRVSLLAWDLLMREAATLTRLGVDCVLDGNFRAPQAEALRALAPAPRFIEVHCMASPEMLRARYLARAVDGTRHPGHVDYEALPEIEREFTASATSLGLAGPVVEWDTTRDFDAAALAQRLDPLL